MKKILLSTISISLLAGCATTKEVDVKIVKVQQDLESKIESTENKISMTSVNIDSVNKELDSLASDIAEVGKQSNTLEKKITAYEKINKINTKIASLSQAIVAYQDIIIANKKMLGSMREQLVNFDTHIQDLAKKLTVIQQEFAQYKADTDLVQDSEEKPLINDK
jgi:chromosome segregation ATPase